MRIEPVALGLLSGEGVRDASRRRIVPAVLVLSFLSLVMMDSCTSCTPNVMVEGEATTVDIARWTGILSFAVLGMWSIALAGLLAADHLRSIFEDGSATLWLARPVSRPTLALARLLGSLAVSLPAALIVCVGATFFLVARSNLAVAPAVVATGAVVLSSITMAALAMTLSLFLPRIVTVLLVFGSVGLIGSLNLWSASVQPLTGLYFAIDRFGPPLLSTIVLALSPWTGQAIASISFWDVALRALVWGVGSVVLLLVVFDQRELAKLEPR